MRLRLWKCWSMTTSSTRSRPPPTLASGLPDRIISELIAAAPAHQGTGAGLLWPGVRGLLGVAGQAAGVVGAQRDGADRQQREEGQEASPARPTAARRRRGSMLR